MAEIVDMAELFARDPLSLTQDDITVIIAKMRESRKNFKAGDIKAGSTKPQSEGQKALAELGAKISLNLNL